MQHVVRSVRKLHRRRTISSLETISIERERLHELRQNKEDMCNKVIHIVVIPYLRLNTAANKLDSNEQLIFLSLQNQKTLTCTMQSVYHQSFMTSQTPGSCISNA